MRQPQGSAGFTLVEVLVALAIVSVALLAATRAASQGTGGVGELRSRLLAGWVAENLVAEQRARADWPAPGMHRGTARQGGYEFAWREEVVPMPNPSFRRVNVTVYSATDETHVLARLTGFLARAPQAAR